MEKLARHSRRAAIAIIGSIVLVVGVIAIPYPGPGILIVLSGLAILSTEFSWAKQALDVAKMHYDAWTDWIARQSMLVRTCFLVGTGLVVLLTMWLLNVFGILADLLSLHFEWLKSPIL